MSVSQAPGLPRARDLPSTLSSHRLPSRLVYYFVVVFIFIYPMNNGIIKQTHSCKNPSPPSKFSCACWGINTTLR